MGNVPTFPDQSMTKAKDPRACPDCHFLCRWSRQVDGRKTRFEMSQEDRDALRQLKSAFFVAEQGYTVGCYFGVWDAGEPDPRKQGSAKYLDQHLSERPGETCFYFGYIPGMEFAVAEELERRRANRREAERDRRLTRRAFKVAFVALIVSMLTALASLIWDVWKYHHRT